MFSTIKNFVNDNKFNLSIFDNCIHINNYQEIITLEETRVSVTSAYRMITIKGKNLSINRLMDNEILISGEVKEVDFNEI